MSYLPGKFIWFEHASNDIPKARAFYEPLFGWHTETMPMGDKTYHMIQNGGVGIGGFCPPAAGTPVGWVSYMSVTDVDASYAAALAAGAKPLEPPTDFPPVGRSAVLCRPDRCRDINLEKQRRRSSRGGEPALQRMVLERTLDAGRRQGAGLL